VTAKYVTTEATAARTSREEMNVVMGGSGETPFLMRPPGAAASRNAPRCVL